MAARAAPAARVDSAALGAQLPEEPAAPVRGLQVLLRQRVLADLLLRLPVLVPPRLAVLVRRPVPAGSLLEERPALAHLAAVPVELPLSRPWFSAAMARSTP